MRKLFKIQAGRVLTIAFLVLFSLVILLSALRGNAGNPTQDSLNQPIWHDKGPFELSPERGRFALTYSFLENHSFYFSVPIARFATPDLGYANGHYVSLFAPAVSFIIMPGYLIGKIFDISQVGSFAIIALFALFNALLIRTIAIRLGANQIASTISAIIFLFATPAFPYAVTLYQHHISTFLILLSIYILLRWKNWLSLGFIWLLVAASIPIDYPNLVLLAPIAVTATGRLFWVEIRSKKALISIKPLNFFSPMFIIIPLLFYVWFSQASYGKPFQLAGTVAGVDTIDQNGQPAKSRLATDSNVEQSVNPDQKPKKSAVAFFQTRNLLNGFYIHLISPDRGILFFTPVMFFGIAGFCILFKKNQPALTLIVGVIGANIILYSMWGDPWGGWAFGSRYLIPSYAMSAILIAIALSTYRRKLLFIFPFLIVAAYSIAVNTVGALTTSANPPQVQVLALEKQTGKPQKYTVERNIDYLTEAGTKSFVYNTFLKETVSPVQYYAFIAGTLIIVTGGMVVFLFIKHE